MNATDTPMLHRTHQDVGLAWRLDGEVRDDLPLVVLCNGLGLDMQLWQPFVDALEGVFPVLRWDYPGHGYSERSADEQSMTIEGLADGLAELVEVVGGKKLVLVGHSIGVQIALHFFARNEDLVAGLVLLSGAPHHPLAAMGLPPVSTNLVNRVSTVFDHYREPLQSTWQAVTKLPALPRLVRKVATNPVMTDGTRFQLWMESIGRLRLDSFLRTLDLAERYDPIITLRDVHVPTLVIGAEFDWIAPHAVARSMVRELPDAELFTVRRGSHLAMLDDPETLALRIEKFITEKTTTLTVQS